MAIPPEFGALQLNLFLSECNLPSTIGTKQSPYIALIDFPNDDRLLL